MDRPSAELAGDPEGVEALPGEDDAAYAARQVPCPAGVLHRIFRRIRCVWNYTILTELAWETPIVSGSVAPKAPSAA